MQKAYSRINWENDPSTNTPLGENYLNKMDKAIDTLDDRVLALYGYESRASQSEANAKTYASNANTSALNASESEKNAKESELLAKEYMEKSFEYSENAKNSKNNAEASEKNAINSATSAQTHATSSKSYAEASQLSQESALTYASNAQSSATNAENYATSAQTHANTASEKAKEVTDYAERSRSYAVGTNGEYRDNDLVDNAKYYYEQAKGISEGLQGALLPMGTISFSQLALQTKETGYMYNISDEFTTDNTFKEGSGYTYPAGTNVYYTADGYWDCLAGTQVTGVKGDIETTYRKGNVNITPENIGLGKVENKSSETIRSELTKTNVTDALGYTPIDKCVTYDVATATQNGLMSAADKEKLDGISNSADSVLFSQKLSSGEEIGIITINDSDTKIYAPANTDTKVTQTATTSNASYPLLLAPSGQTATATTTSYFDNEVTLNPSTNTIVANISGNAATATSATKLGSSTVGGMVTPIYLNGGTATACSTYAGGTAVTLNGTNKSATSASFYAPTTAGTNGYVLTSNGSGAPTWSAQTGMTTVVVSATSADADNYTTTGNYYFSTSTTLTNFPSGANGWLVVYSAGNYIKQIWYRHGTANSNDHLTYVRTRTATSTWSDWTQIITGKGGTFTTGFSFANGAGIVASTGTICIPNGTYYQSYDSTGTARNCISLSSANKYTIATGGVSNTIQIGTSSYTTQMQLLASGRIDFCALGKTINDNAISIAAYSQTTSVTVPCLRPTGDAYLGDTSYRWIIIYSESALNISSDRRKKDDIQDLDERYLALWDELLPQSYYLKVDETQRRHLGFIAQDVEEAMLKVGLTYEECGFLHKDWVERDDYTGYEYALSYDDLAVLTMAKSKQQQSEIDSLKSELAEIKSIIATLIK